MTYTINDKVICTLENVPFPAKIVDGRMEDIDGELQLYYQVQTIEAFASMLNKEFPNLFEFDQCYLIWLNDYEIIKLLKIKGA